MPACCRRDLSTAAVACAQSHFQEHDLERWIHIARPLDRTRVGRVSCQFGRHWPPASVSRSFSPRSSRMNNSTQKIFGCGSLVVLLTSGAAGSVWCFSKHVCMGGHMEHPPYAFTQYAADTAWTVALVAIPVISRLLRLFGRWWWLTLAVIALPIYRFVFGSGGGFGVLGLPM